MAVSSFPMGSFGFFFPLDAPRPAQVPKNASAPCATLTYASIFYDTRVRKENQGKKAGESGHFATNFLRKIDFSGKRPERGADNARRCKDRPHGWPSRGNFRFLRRPARPIWQPSEGQAPARANEKRRGRGLRSLAAWGTGDQASVGSRRSRRTGTGASSPTGAKSSVKESSSSSTVQGRSLSAPSSKTNAAASAANQNYLFIVRLL